MKCGSFEFSLRELAGSMGDFGTLFPLAVGYMVTCGLDPSGFLVVMGLANIVTGLVYRLPLPVEPMKVLAVTAVAGHWPPYLVFASTFTMGLVWLFFAATGLIDRVAKITPPSVVRGIQAALGVLLALEALRLIDGDLLLGVASVLVVLLLRDNARAPAALVLMGMGVIILAVRGDLASLPGIRFSLPPLTGFALGDMWHSLVQGGFAQIPLTATNAVIATSALISEYWPDRRVSERRLSLNMGIMNCVGAFLGGFPLCSGAGGLAGQYYFGARTGGANIIEGVLEVTLGLFLGSSLARLFERFPGAIIGAMMLLVGLQLTTSLVLVKRDRHLLPLLATLAVSLATNMAFGFLAGLFAHHILLPRISGDETKSEP
ncbi:putative sulfate/molybdate transporter [Aminiphilus sp.]|uniref:putative sulfate/molybdate transporter n=1 Tax=Aminiphilus sp. TaxID=1872488 RepID=UPI002635C79D|nr:putative sulfate/molybdate transporter [Aminiphilus sp.]